MAARSAGLWIATGLTAAACAGVWTLTVSLATTADEEGPGAGEKASADGLIREGASSTEQLEAIRDRISRHIADEQPNQAAALAERAVDLFPRDRELRTLYAETLELLDEFEGAFEQYIVALELGGDDAELEYRAGLAANTAGMRGEAQRLLEAAVAHDPENGSYALNLGLVYERSGDMEQAEVWLQHARKLSPNADMAWGMLAEIARREARFEEARSYIDRARELNKRRARWLLVDADLLVREDPLAAVELLETLDRLDRDDEFALRVAKKIYGRLGRFEDAAWWFSDASDADESNAGLAAETAELFERADDLDNAIFYSERAVNAGDERSLETLERLRALRTGG